MTPPKEPRPTPNPNAQLSDEEFAEIERDLAQDGDNALAFLAPFLDEDGDATDDIPF
jgi:hypothetical protein